MKPIVVIESPYAGGIEKNLSYARAAMRDSIRRGEAPIVSHLLYTQILDDDDQNQRLLGMSLGWEFYRVANFVAVYEDYGISPGMIRGINRAQAAGLKIKYRKLDITL